MSRAAAAQAGPLVANSPPLDGPGPGPCGARAPEPRVRPTHQSLRCDELGGGAWHQFAARDASQDVAAADDADQPSVLDDRH
jgi:hypothetical protein